MAVKLQFFGYAAYLIQASNGKNILIDPYLNQNPVSPVKANQLGRVDLLLITHNAYDHFGDAAEIIRQHRCPVICAKDVAHNLTAIHGIDPDLLRVTIWGMEMEVAGIPVRPIESHHWSFGVTPDGQLLSGPAMGFIVDAGQDVRIYHPGDTAITYDMKLWGELYRPTVGLMHVTLPENSLPHMECYRCGELTVYEALLASQWLGLSHIVASHYADPAAQDVKDFVHLVASARETKGLSAKVSVMRPGEIIDL
ncbi:MAG: MBL fold metallo-hydrolase [Chloroflexota bacterium]|nr:MAG: MBL fold metallo-hydrolase [Chloroflexota bacterium]